MRGLTRCFEPERDPAPAAANAERWRTGARRRASRQMNSEIPPSTTIAPIAIATALPLLSPLPLVDEVVATVGTVCVAGGVVAGGVGSPRLNGLLVVVPWAAALEVTASGNSATTVATAGMTARALTLCERLRHSRCVGCLHIRMFLGDIFFVVDALGVDRPDVVTGPKQ